MDMNTFLAGVAVGIVAGVISGIVLAVILGAWHGIWRYLSSILNDIRLTLAAINEGKYQEAHAHDRRATMKMVGCFGIALLLEILACIVMVITVVVAAAANPRH